MNPFWITLWFSSMTILPSTATFMDTLRPLFMQGHTFTLVASTASAAGYISALGEYENRINFTDMTEKRAFKVTEQALLFSSTGAVIFMGSKFLAPFKWIVTASYTPYDGISDPFYTPQNYDYTMSQSSWNLANYTVREASSTKLKYLIFRGDEYDFKDTYSFSFKKKP